MHGKKKLKNRLARRGDTVVEIYYTQNGKKHSTTSKTSQNEIIKIEYYVLIFVIFYNNHF